MSRAGVQCNYRDWNRVCYLMTMRSQGWSVRCTHGDLSGSYRWWVWLADWGPSCLRGCTRFWVGYYFWNACQWHSAVRRSWSAWWGVGYWVDDVLGLCSWLRCEVLEAECDLVGSRWRLQWIRRLKRGMGYRCKGQRLTKLLLGCKVQRSNYSRTLVRGRNGCGGSSYSTRSRKWAPTFLQTL